jgi:methionyl-tRNA synthetase
MICDECGQDVNRATFKAPVEWISVNEKKPPEDTKLLFKLDQEGKSCKNYHCHPIFSGFWAQEGEWKSVYVLNGQDCAVLYEDITHWMPLPCPPRTNE